jgi:hypothetical protein
MTNSNQYATVGERLDAYKRWQLQCDYVAGALGVLLVVIGFMANVFTSMPSVIWAILVTLAILAGASVGRARLGLSSVDSLLKEDIERQALQRTDELPDNRKALPAVERVTMWIGLALLIISGCVLIIAAWAVTESHQPATCDLGWYSTTKSLVCVGRGSNAGDPVVHTVTSFVTATVTSTLISTTTSTTTLPCTAPPVPTWDVPRTTSGFGKG